MGAATCALAGALRWPWPSLGRYRRDLWCERASNASACPGPLPWCLPGLSWVRLCALCVPPRRPPWERGVCITCVILRVCVAWTVRGAVGSAPILRRGSLRLRTVWAAGPVPGVTLTARGRCSRENPGLRLLCRPAFGSRLPREKRLSFVFSFPLRPGASTRLTKSLDKGGF